MKKIEKLILICFLITMFSSSSCENSPRKKHRSQTYSHEHKFIDFGYMLSPNEYDGRVFKLNSKYPKRKPNADKKLQSILSIDFKKDWLKYLEAVQEYIYEGNANPNDLENSFFLEDNNLRKWYHVPWLHWGSTGREGHHGLTKEGPVAQHMLAPSQESESSSYAVGFYNNLGGYAIGKIWSDPNNPNYKALINEGFPVGTVVAKLLFVPYDEKQIPYLINPVTWNAYIYSSDIPGKKKFKPDDREMYPLRLIQMDIMVRDKRAKSTGGWVFGTFVYQGKLNKKNRWMNLMPVGIMWGNDPNEKLSSNNPTPTKTIINSRLKETIINSSPDLPPMHLGWGSRLNGPVDNPSSSCMSCHSTAQYPVVSNLLPMFNHPAVPVPKEGTEASREWMKWFRNVQCNKPFDKGKAVSLDYSLQLTKSITNYYEYIQTTKKGFYFDEYIPRKTHEVIRNRIE